MDCENISSLYGKIFDGEADEADHKALENHLKICRDCMDDYNWYKFSVQALNNLQSVSPPVDFIEQLNKRIHPASKFSGVKHFVRSLLDSVPQLPVPVGVASLAVVMIFAFMAYNNVPMESGVAIAPLAGAKGVAAYVESSPPGAKIAQNSGEMAPSSSGSTARLPMIASSHSPSATQVSAMPGWRFPTIADEIGGDNLTVESPRIDLAVESLRNVLPNIQGQIVDERIRTGLGDVTLGVVIPSNRYADLATALINHGSVEAGSLQVEGKALVPSKTNTDQLHLYIRFTRSTH